VRLDELYEFGNGLSVFDGAVGRISNSKAPDIGIQIESAVTDLRVPGGPRRLAGLDGRDPASGLVSTHKSLSAQARPPVWVSRLTVRYFDLWSDLSAVFKPKASLTSSKI
jgi:hypothetical protein